MEKWIRGGEALWKPKRDQNLENYGNEITTINMLFLACGEESFLVARGIAYLSREVSDSWSLTALSRMNVLDVRNALAWMSICVCNGQLSLYSTVQYSETRCGAIVSGVAEPGLDGQTASAGCFSFRSPAHEMWIDA